MKKQIIFIAPDIPIQKVQKIFKYDVFEAFDIISNKYVYLIIKPSFFLGFNPNNPLAQTLHEISHHKKPFFANQLLTNVFTVNPYQNKYLNHPVFYKLNKLSEENLLTVKKDYPEFFI